MKRIRFRVIILACWLVVFSNLDHLLEPFNVSEFTYTAALVMAITVLIIPHAGRIPLWATLAVSVPFILFYKALTGALAENISVVMMLLEEFFMFLTTLLAFWVNMAIHEFERSVAHVTIGQRDKIPESDSAGQGQIYREVRRARNHQRPLSLMAIAVDEKSIKVAVDRMVQEAQQAMMKQYTLFNVSKTLCNKLEDSDIVVQMKDHFLIVLPETGSENIPGLIDRLRQQVLDQVGVDLKIGSASLPIDGFTFEGLLHKATLEMQADLEPHPMSEVERLLTKQNLS